MDLPDNVIEALRARQKIKAIKLLREQRDLGLKEAKEIVEQYTSQDKMIFSDAGKAIPRKGAKKNYKALSMGLLVVAAFVWAMVNLVAVVGSSIMLWHHDGYKEVTFTVRRVHYDDDAETGLVWGFIGNLPNGEARMYAPKLVDAKVLGYRKLRRMYPPGMQMKALYNPDVTGTLIQYRTINLIPYTPDLVRSELAVIYRWLIYCLLPFAGALLLARAVQT
jgi:hypothetical protein